MKKIISTTFGGRSAPDSTRITERKIGGDIVQFQTLRARSFSSFKSRMQPETSRKPMEAPADVPRRIIRVLVYSCPLVGRLSEADRLAVKKFLAENSRPEKGMAAEVHFPFKNVSTAAYMHLNEVFNVFPRSRDSMVVVTLKEK